MGDGKLEMNMAKRYCCAACGSELTPGKYAVDLSPLVFLGTLEGEADARNPVYINETELENLIKSGENNDGVIEMTIESLFGYAYSEENQRWLEASKTSAEDAVETYKEILESPQKAKEDDDSNKNDAEDSVGFKRGRKKKEQADSKAENDICIPGFTKFMTAQAKSNFPKGVARFKIEKDEEYGIRFEHLSYAGVDKSGAGTGRRCPHCKAKILHDAFKKTQYLVGVVGFQKVGKSCLIAALCNTLLNRGRSAALEMPHEAWKANYAVELDKYRKGYSVSKTVGGGTNTYNPSVVEENAIWTFVDVPGEAVQNPVTGDLNINSILNKFKSILRCDAYIFCASYKAVAEESEQGQMISVFKSLLNNLENKNRPILFALTQEDEEIKDDGTGAKLIDGGVLKNCLLTQENEEIKDDGTGAKLIDSGVLKNCLHLKYGYYKETKFLLKRHNKMLGILETLAKDCYLTAITCSAYGFEPYRPEAYQEFMIDSENNPSRCPESKNIDVILEWVEKLYGVREVRPRGKSEDSIRMDGHALQKSEVHNQKEVCDYISWMFVNPSDLDKMYSEAFDDGFPGIVRRVLLNAKLTLNGQLKI